MPCQIPEEDLTPASQLSGCRRDTLQLSDMDVAKESTLRSYFPDARMLSFRKLATVSTPPPPAKAGTTSPILGLRPQNLVDDNGCRSFVVPASGVSLQTRGPHIGASTNRHVWKGRRFLWNTE